MKAMKFFQFAAMAVAAVFTLSMTSCDDDDDAKGIKCNPATLTLEVGKTADVKLAGGTEAYTVKTTDANTATAVVNKSTITVTGVKEGKATITITDANKLSAALPVTVAAKNADVTLDKTSVSVGVGKEEVVTVKTGTAPYTVSVKDSKTVTASVKDSKVTIKGVKAGTTTVTITDKNKNAATVAVTVSETVK